MPECGVHCFAMVSESRLLCKLPFQEDSLDMFLVTKFFDISDQINPVCWHVILIHLADTWTQDP